MSTAAIGRIDGLSWRNRRASAVTDVDAIATHNGVDGVARGLAWGGGWRRVGLGVVVGGGWVVALLSPPCERGAKFGLHQGPDRVTEFF